MDLRKDLISTESTFGHALVKVIYNKRRLMWVAPVHVEDSYSQLRRTIE